ncbi:NADPH-dependent 2,4-dienoyl-CoA reductase/sulfur reductase-like enzyme [Arthrobacter sp. MW3 TE3886]
MTGHPSSHPNQGATSAAPRRIVVAGGGPAAHRFADAMHARGLDGWHVTVLTEEAHLPYDRVALSKALTDSDVDLTLGSASMWDHTAPEPQDRRARHQHRRRRQDRPDRGGNHLSV